MTIITADALIEKVRRYEPDADAELLQHAYDFAKAAHGEQRRCSGDPYFVHLVETAWILTELRMDASAVAAGLLHDVLEDTPVTYRELKIAFNPVIAQLVGGVTRLTYVEAKIDLTQAENARKMILAIAIDSRILMIKLADRLHNLRTIQGIPDRKRRARIVQEAISLYGPLAERAGLYDMCREFNDLATQELHPEAFADIVKQCTQADKYYEPCKAALNRVLEMALPYRVQAHGRVKSVGSIWHKMQKKKLNFKQLSDVLAFRIVTQTLQDCYAVLDALHTHYRIVPGLIKDYIIEPKTNKYQSMHTVLIIPPYGGKVEVQIRTKSMHDIAEHGNASHWHYKILEEREKNPTNAQYALERGHIFCLTPVGQIVVLKEGSRALDFAYAIHTDIGKNAIVAGVNNKEVSLNTKLHNGDMVEILSRPVRVPILSLAYSLITRKAKKEFKKQVEGTVQTFEHLG